MAIVIQQSSEEVRPGWWHWQVWLEGNPFELQEIRSVVYHLHPTFPDPERTVTDATSGFKISAAGWGTFTLGVEICYENGASELRNLDLVLVRGAPSRGASTGPRSLLLLHGSSYSPVVEQIRESLRVLGVDVADSSSLRGGAWSKELIEGIRGHDAILSIGQPESEGFEIETRIAEKLGKPVIKVDPAAGSLSLAGTRRAVEGTGSMADLSRGIVEAFKLTE